MKMSAGTYNKMVQQTGDYLASIETTLPEILANIDGPKIRIQWDVLAATIRHTRLLWSDFYGEGLTDTHIQAGLNKLWKGVKK